MIPEPIVRRAVVDDLPAILRLLEQAGLPRDGAADHLAGFLVAEEELRVIGCGALERYGSAALLRSVAIDPAARRGGLGTRIVQALLEIARREDFDTITLLTTTAGEFFPRFGFRRIERSDVPGAVVPSKEFQGACPSSATIMRLDLTPAGSREGSRE